MPVFTKVLEFSTRGQGMLDVTQYIDAELKESGLSSGVVTLFCQHTSCSLVVMENADPSARVDLEAFMNRLVPEGDPCFTHVYEGTDDMPSHIKMALTRTSEAIPFDKGKLCLGVWQGIFLWEHRQRAHLRRIVFSAQGE